MHVPIKDCPHCRVIKREQTSAVVRVSAYVSIAVLALNLAGIAAVVLFERWVLGRR